MLPISNRERETIIFHKNNKEKNEDIARWTRISVSTITRIWNLYKASGSFEPKPKNSGRKPLVSKETMELVVSKIQETPDITLLELIDEFNLQISESALCKRLIKRGLTFKKRHSIQKHSSVKMSPKLEPNGKRIKKN